MALSKLQKGLVGLGIAVVAVIAVGYGGMRYLENAVVDAIRTWAAQTPQDAHVELGDISYTLMDNHLVLKNVRHDVCYPGKADRGRYRRNAGYPESGDHPAFADA